MFPKNKYLESRYHQAGIPGYYQPGFKLVLTWILQRYEAWKKLGIGSIFKVRCVNLECGNILKDVQRSDDFL